MNKNTYFFLRKKAIVSITTYSLILFLAVILLISSISFYNVSKNNFIIKVHEKEVLNSILSFRSDLLNLVSYNNSNLIYFNSNDANYVIINLNNTNIEGVDLSLNKKIIENISSLGINFCSNYSFSPVVNNTFKFNSTCVSLI